uniref:Cytochrome c oxidase subunit 2 n=1 Tax=Metacrangonyx dominicanus TaxID=1199168 RepID=K7ZVM0_9CRUS|nr:cytochrome c oxidase subunit II [Metacrangonyx dominicanus]CCI69357.1 cytochrome oxidase subunit 2 [Metacrangonyx dominicanus]
MLTWFMLNFQDASSSIMEQLIFFHDFTMMIIIFILTLVGTNLLFICYYKFTNRYFNQEQTIESIWTIAPIFILLLIALPSLRVLYFLDDSFDSHLTMKVMGHQWYWSYEYPYFKNLSFDSYMVPVNDLASGEFRLLETDNSLVLPVNLQIRMIVSASDVIHAWALPSLGLKVDAVPGRLNQMNFMISRCGIFYGQCSEICGANHSFMPIKLECVPMKYFINWLEKLNS